ncbi:MAG: hypothetical protein ACLFVS_04820 [Candidatus Acetothermia bacterium]
MPTEVIAKIVQLGSLLKKEDKYSAESWLGVTLEDDPIFFRTPDMGSLKYEAKQVLLVRQRFKVETCFHCSSRDRFDFDATLTIPFRSLESTEILRIKEFFSSGGRPLLTGESLTEDVEAKIESKVKEFVYSHGAERLQYEQPEEEIRDALTVPLDNFASPRAIEFTPARFSGSFKSEEFIQQEKAEKIRKKKLEREEFKKLIFLTEIENEMEKVKRIDEEIEEREIGPWYRDYLNQLDKIEDGHPVNASTRTLQKWSPSGMRNFRRSLGERKTAFLLIAIGSSVYTWYPENRGFNELIRREDLDGIRSVNLVQDEDEIWIALGHRRGISMYRWDRDFGSPIDLYIPPDAVNKSGFNSATTCSNKVYGSNSRSGVFEWELSLDDPQPNKILASRISSNLPRARGVKRVGDSGIAFLSGDSLFLYETETGSYNRLTSEKKLPAKSQNGFVDYCVDRDTSTLETIDGSGTITVWDIDNRAEIDTHRVYAKDNHTINSVEILKREYYLLSVERPFCPLYPKDNPSLCISSYESPGNDIYFTDGRSDYLFGLDKYGAKLFVWEVDKGGGKPSLVEELRSRFGHGASDFTIVDDSSPLASRL